MSTNTLLITGSDKLGLTLAVKVRNERPHVKVYLDRSGGLKRVYRLVRRGALPPGLVLRMALADFQRSAPEGAGDLPSIRTNQDLIDVIQRERPHKIYFFRAGLIVNTKVLSLGPEFINIHCSRLPDYGGLGTIDRALRDGALDQCATMHRMTGKIDEGEVLATEPYRLDPNSSYSANENTAYAAGMALALRILQQPSSSNA